MPSHNNVHIPSESFPSWIWQAIEFGILLAASMLISSAIMDTITTLEPDVENWVYFGMVVTFFIVWYGLIRGIVFKKPILHNS